MSTGARAVGSLLMLGMLASSVRAADEKTDWKFSFGETKPADGTVQVAPNSVYDKAQGFGYEAGAAVAAKGEFTTSEKPFYFSVALPEGNYNVTLTLGNPAAESVTTVKAELRRLMLENVKADAGKSVTRTITVNVRTPEISTGGKVKLKGRESTSEIWGWDEKLTLEFNGNKPGISTMEVSKADVPTVYILGDSTVCDQPTEPWNSWGQMLTRFFTPGVAVSNQAESGESLRSSLGAHRLDKVLSTIKPGDYLFVQYGHNDMKEKGAGVGAFTTYTADLKKFVDGAKEKGATPVLVTSMNRKSMDSSGHVTNTLGDYPEAVRRVAKEENVALIDLNDMSKTLYEAIGPKDIGKAFQDGTHHNGYGSYELAQCIIVGIQQNKLDLAKFVADDWKGFDPAKPDAIASFDVPASPAFSAVKPLGN
jgi:lysophospholipase L1-like esterase